jgi:hypothetical protein
MSNSREYIEKRKRKSWHSTMKKKNIEGCHHHGVRDNLPLHQQSENTSELSARTLFQNNATRFLVDGKGHRFPGSFHSQSGLLGPHQWPPEVLAGICSRPCRRRSIFPFPSRAFQKIHHGYVEEAQNVLPCAGPEPDVPVRAMIINNLDRHSRAVDICTEVLVLKEPYRFGGGRRVWCLGNLASAFRDITDIYLDRRIWGALRI